MAACVTSVPSLKMRVRSSKTNFILGPWKVCRVRRLRTLSTLVTMPPMSETLPRGNSAGCSSGSAPKGPALSGKMVVCGSVELAGAAVSLFGEDVVEEAFGGAADVFTESGAGVFGAVVEPGSGRACVVGAGEPEPTVDCWASARPTTVMTAKNPWKNNFQGKRVEQTSLVTGKCLQGLLLGTAPRAAKRSLDACI